VPLTAALTVLAAYLSHRLVEAPVRRLANARFAPAVGRSAPETAVATEPAGDAAAPDGSLGSAPRLVSAGRTS
jgi:peptidoglycan/LPS O-acetylase OafA/YrhL